jgi:Flp pilus assembly protein TadD
VAPAFLGNDYRPLFLVWLRINDALFGQWAAGWHFTSVSAHVAATYCVVLLAHRLLDEWPGALLSGLIFGLHPIHIEGVAWISGVPEPLLACLLITSYLCWLRSHEASGGGGIWLGASLGLYTLALLTKETAVVLVPILLASEWLDFPVLVGSRRTRRGRRIPQILKDLLPFLALTAFYLIVRTVALKGFSHPAAQVSWLTMVLTWPSLLLFYIRLLVWPVGLSPFYALQFVSHPTLGNTVFPVLVLLTVAVGLGIWASKVCAVALVIPWLIFPLFPVLDVAVFGNGNFAHNRYLYLPSVGFAMLVSLALRKLKVGTQYFRVIHSLQLWTAIGLAVVLGLAINIEDRYYSSDAAFYSLAYSRVGRSYPVIGMDFANALAEQGDFAHAAAIYRELIKARPDMWTAYFNLGYMYYQQGDLDSAEQYLSRTAGGDPGNAAAIFYLGLTDLKLHHLDEAEANLRRAIGLAPKAPNYHFALGMVLKVKGNRQGALAEFARELEVNPAHQAAVQQAEEIQREIAGR